jgi:hypothetical protein
MNSDKHSPPNNTRTSIFVSAAQRPVFKTTRKRAFPLIMRS